ncbi:hypothetical protein, partial [Cecembia lonarensis]|uniref:hypothetical protein n=1 Tax=Cecembia lonarensis TaxID=645110 RepID=UPI001EE66DA4
PSADRFSLHLMIGPRPTGHPGGLHYLVSLPCISFPVATMSSADFLVHRNRVYSKTSPEPVPIFLSG